MTKKHETFWAAWRKACLPLFIISVIILSLENTAILRPFESFGIDFLVHLFHTPISSDIFLVEITDNDYLKSFGNKSPLDGAKLQTLLKAIRSTDPAVIGVDLDTSDTHMDEIANDPKFVWAEVPQQTESDDPKKAFLSLVPVVGRIKDPNRMAMPQFPQDEDGVVRRFEDKYQVLDGRDWVQIDSMPCALARVADRKVHCEFNSEARRFSLTGNHFQFQKVDAGEILSWPEEADHKDTPFAGKVVIVGGNYRAARDNYVTPAGELAGVEVIANATQSYLPGGRAIIDAPKWASFLYDIFAGTVVVFIFWIVPRKFKKHKFLGLTRHQWAFWCSLIGGTFVCLVVSWALFWISKFWLGFFPVIVSMVMHQLYEHQEKLKEEDEATSTPVRKRTSSAFT